ncbi:YolD-like family protein [Paenibacillus sp. 1P07SE]|uniref:YolD-like family protein n=1 Tax=Paenibacillus sp. 1P07SE TaxID=3132209 RepID=UPI0039A66D90
MKETKVTPGSNKIFKSSGFIVPEHKEAILRQQREAKRLKKPMLDEQQVAEIEQLLQHSKAEGVELTLPLFSDFEYETVFGIVKRMDRYGVELEGEERTFLPFDRIIEASYR